MQVFYVVPFDRYDASFNIRAELIRLDNDNVHYNLAEIEAILKALVATSRIEQKEDGGVLLDGYRKIDSRTSSTQTPKPGILAPAC
jgi:hypothetical protein